MQRCYGEMMGDEPICEGPDIREIRFKVPGDTTVYTTHWCRDCRLAAAYQGYQVGPTV